MRTQSFIYTRRRIVNVVAMLLSGIATLIGLAFLSWILWITLKNGVSALSVKLFTKITAYGSEGGLSNAIVGSIGMDLLALLICAPIGVLAGTYLAEYASRSKFGSTVRFLNDILLSAPSIVLGLLVYVIVVHPMSDLTNGGVSFSGLAGAIALALIGLPVIVRTTDEMLRLVPSTLREAALSLGIPQWKLTLQVLIRAAISGILTGIILEVSRTAGETAPIMFTGAAFFLPLLPQSVFDQTMALSLHLFVVSTQVPGMPEQLPFGVALVLISLVLLMNSLSIALRMYLRGKKKW